MKIRDKLYYLWLRSVRSASILLNAIGMRVWLIELMIVVPIALSAHHLWVFGLNASSGIVELVSFIWSTVPVLAISNALPMLGAAAVLARYSVSEKPAEALKQINDALLVDGSNFLELKGNLLRNVSSVQRVMNESPATLSFFNKDEPLFVPRPDWDGVWCFPWSTSRTPIERAVHETTYCAIQVVRLVRDVQRHKVALVGGIHGGSNGSLSFLRRLKKVGRPKISKNMTRETAVTWAKLAHYSLHYMREELSNHLSTTDLDEARETEFIRIFCEYMKWLGFFQTKFLTARWLTLTDRYPNIKDHAIRKKIEIFVLRVSSARSALDHIAIANLPRRAAASRVKQIRRGIIIPLLSTMSATMICLSLKPLAGLNPATILNVASIAYSLIAASLAANFTFGLWLLMPLSTRH